MCHVTLFRVYNILICSNETCQLMIRKSTESQSGKRFPIFLLWENHKKLFTAIAFFYGIKFHN
jgi:hypothetical protein